jgi:hypothetical protein
MAPFYAAIWPRLSGVARDHGYALALHGTLGRDMDLIACPWTDDAAPGDVLVEALAEASDGWVPEYAKASDEPEPVKMPRPKPHGRTGWLIYFKRADCYLDVSVMPRAPAEGEKP